MELQYWGTAAAEGVPGIFCGCAVCREAREKGGRYIRTRSQVLLDGSLLVDFGADTYMHSLKYGFDMSRLEHVMITHVHSDHFYPHELIMRKTGYANSMSSEALTLHGSPDVQEQAMALWDAYGPFGRKLVEEGRVAFDVIGPYESREICGFKVTALPATHGTNNPYIYVFEKSGRAMLLHNDCGYLKPEVLDWLQKSGIKFDLVSYECTYAAQDASEGGKYTVIGHLGIPNVIEERRRLKSVGCYKDSTIDVITHFSHNPVTAGYGDMLKYAEDAGCILAYDGMKIEF